MQVVETYDELDLRQFKFGISESAFENKLNKILQ